MVLKRRQTKREERKGALEYNYSWIAESERRNEDGAEMRGEAEAEAEGKEAIEEGPQIATAYMQESSNNGILRDVEKKMTKDQRKGKKKGKV